MTIRKCLAIGFMALMLPAAVISTAAPASAGWLVRGYPLHVRYHYFHYHRGYTNYSVRPFSGGGGGCCPNSMLVCPLGRHFC